MNTKQRKLLMLASGAVCLALALVLPFLTGQIPEIGSMLCPMHIPVLLCGFVCGPWYGAMVGFIAPLLRFVLFGMPPIMPTGIAMSLELCAYGVISGLLYRYLPRKIGGIYAALVAAMLCGRAVWGAARVVLMGLGSSTFSWAAFMTGAFTNAVPGILVQLILIPALVLALQKALPWMKKQ